MQVSITGSLLKSFRNLLRPCINLKQFTTDLQSPTEPEQKIDDAESKKNLYAEFKKIKNSTKFTNAYNLYLKDQYEEKRDYYLEIGTINAAQEIAKKWHMMEYNKKKDYLTKFQEDTIAKKEDLKALTDQLTPEELEDFEKKCAEQRKSRNKTLQQSRRLKERRRRLGPPRPLSSYLIFYMEYRKLNNIETKSLKSTHSIVKIVSQKWKELDKESKEKYVSEYKRLLEEYKVDKAHWNAKLREEDKLKEAAGILKVKTPEEKIAEKEILKKRKRRIRKRQNLIIHSTSIILLRQKEVLAKMKRKHRKLIYPNEK